MSYDFEVKKVRSLWVFVEVLDLESESFFTAEAKVYDLPDGKGPDYNGYGVRENSRVSKLLVRDGYTKAPLFEWNRGPAGSDEAPDGLVDAIVDFMEEAPMLGDGS